MKLGVLFSGGKDSMLAFDTVRKSYDVTCLITIVSKNPESYMFHTPNIHLTKLQAQAMQLPLIEQKTLGVKENELKDLKKAIVRAKKEYGIQGVVTGAIESVYQSSRIQRVCDELGLKCLNPLWKMNQEKVLKEVVERGFETIISGVFAQPFGKDWLGKTVDAKTVDELVEMGKKYEINPAGEGGEIETTVLDAPFFKKKIVIQKSEMFWENYSGVLKVKKAVLVEK
ncbi:MAG: TIGR00289 family protein [Nanoarchaeota archaeon]|nr:TIGR00289 family protein [Nanoarchaeota archaeon]